ncbi:MerR family transcriptional regulator [Microbacterium trichothecenolyticum]|uniref:MerR family transcriptional regulator n=1 Tax=Microbacterium ureisolvens TaxID=2781186 RepID=A0ABS7I1V9_9MICO|nr:MULTISPECIES: MerR family transcriptional regulator [Microbacterium]MBW9110594.1 MerR family transcriptional regulator [Microbacterium ureisolvens]MBW9119639.1 MerR family transcriptional regulator [Microbacterium trichothecenolyticum]
MKMSELSERSGVPVATVKFYIREGMLPRGEAISTTRAEYGDEHLARLRLIAALADVRGLPLSRVRDILELIDAPYDDPIATLGSAVGALPPYVESDRQDFPRAREAIEALGLTYDPDFTAVAQLDDALQALEAAGLDAAPSVLRRYSDAMLRIAADELAPMPGMPRPEAVSYAVLGTALYEPVMLALRRLAHHHLLVTAMDEGRLSEEKPASV